MTAFFWGSYVLLTAFITAAGAVQPSKSLVLHFLPPKYEATMAFDETTKPSSAEAERLVVIKTGSKFGSSMAESNEAVSGTRSALRRRDQSKTATKNLKLTSLIATQPTITTITIKSTTTTAATTTTDTTTETTPETTTTLPPTTNSTTPAATTTSTITTTAATTKPSSKATKKIATTTVETPSTSKPSPRTETTRTTTTMSTTRKITLKSLPSASIKIPKPKIVSIASSQEENKEDISEEKMERKYKKPSKEKKKYKTGALLSALSFSSEKESDVSDVPLALEHVCETLQRKVIKSKTGKTTMKSEDGESRYRNSHEKYFAEGKLEKTRPRTTVTSTPTSRTTGYAEFLRSNLSRKILKGALEDAIERVIDRRIHERKMAISSNTARTAWPFTKPTTVSPNMYDFRDNVMNNLNLREPSPVTFEKPNFGASNANSGSPPAEIAVMNNNKFENNKRVSSGSGGGYVHSYSTPRPHIVLQLDEGKLIIRQRKDTNTQILRRCMGNDAECGSYDE